MPTPPFDPPKAEEVILLRRRIFYAHVGAAVSAAVVVGALLGGLASYLETPISFLLYVVNGEFVTQTSRHVSETLAASMNVPFAFFAFHFILGLAGGLLAGIAGGLLHAALRLQRRRLWAGYLGFQVGVWSFVYLLLWVLHIKLAPGMEKAAVAGILVAGGVLGTIAWLLARLVTAGTAVLGAGVSRWLRIAAAAASVIVVVGLMIGMARHFGRDPKPGRITPGRSYPVMIVGIDGATWSIIRPLMADGVLPNFSRLVKEGVSGPLRTLLPPIESPTVWTTVATGKRPRKHGIRGFVVKSQDTHQLTPVTSDLRRATPYWRIVSDAGLAIDVVCWYVSWPAEDVNGVFVSERLLFPKLDRIVSPPEWKAAIAVHDSEFVATRDQRLAHLTPQPYRPDLGPFDENSHAALEQKHMSILEYTFHKDTVAFDLACDLLKKGQPDVFGVYFEGTDRVSHRFLIHEHARRDPFLWEHLYPAIDKSEMEKYGSVVRNYYMQVDTWLGELLDRVDDNTAVIVLSDHGFGIRKPYKVHLELNPLLEFLGYFHTQAPDENRADWNQTRLFDAYRKSKKLGHIAINLAGREADGIVSRDDMNGILKEARDTLAGLQTKDGRHVFGAVKMLRNAGAPDNEGEIAVTFNEDCLADTLVYQGRRLACSAFTRAEWMPGNHRIDGIFIGRGGPFRRGARIESASVLDIAPTLLKIAGLPPARDMDGRPLDRAFDPALARGLVSGVVDTYETHAGEAHDAARSTSADSTLLQQLRSLGYIR